MGTWAAVIGAVLSIIIGLWKFFRNKVQYKREQAKKAKEDMENAKKNDSESDFLDSFGRF